MKKNMKSGKCSVVFITIIAVLCCTTVQETTAVDQGCHIFQFCESCSGERCVKCIEAGDYGLRVDGLGCLECLEASGGTCSQCSNLTRCHECTSVTLGPVFNTTTAQCDKCASNCRFCQTNGAGKCDYDGCIEGYAIDSNQLCILICSVQCQSCEINGPSKCDDGKCNQGFDLDFDKKCMPIPYMACTPSCQSCAIAGPQKCDVGKCDIGFAMSATQRCSVCYTQQQCNEILQAKSGSPAEYCIPESRGDGRTCYIPSRCVTVAGPVCQNNRQCIPPDHAVYLNCQNNYYCCSCGAFYSGEHCEIKNPTCIMPDCLSCIPGPPNTCSHCRPGFGTPSTTDHTKCILCNRIGGCQQCATYTQCLLCNTTRLTPLHDGSGSCAPCEGNCQICSINEFGKCDRCNSGFTLQSDKTCISQSG